MADLPGDAADRPRPQPAEVASAAAGRRGWARIRRLLTPVVIGAALVGVAVALRQDGAAALDALSQPRAVPLVAAALVANVAGLWLGMLAWQALLADQHGMRGSTAAKIFFLGQLGKYLPGRVWGVLTHVELGRAHGVGAARMSTAYLLSLGLTILSGAGVGLLAAPAALGGRAWWLALPLAGLVACLIRPGLLAGPVAAVSRLVRRPVAPPADRLVRRGLGLAVVSWLVSGLHLWALAVALGAAPAAALAPCLGAFALATVVGSLALVVPDGWGVREITITAALAAVLPWTTAGLTAVTSRVVCIVAELGASLAVLAWARARASRTPSRGESDVHSVHP